MDARVDLQAFHTQADSFLLAMKHGMAAHPRHVSPKYFYDARGSSLFDQICDLPEYYPTRTEIGILTAHAAEMADLIGSDADLVEFGAGSLVKVRLLLDAFIRRGWPCRYVPIDISGEHLESAAQALAAELPDLSICPVAADYTALTELPGVGSKARRRVGFFPGSTIGNMSPDEALAFLSRSAALLRGGGMLIGVDLVKDPCLLHAAYNDRQGLTAAFNLNLLDRANRELHADFDLQGFAHYALYQPMQQRIEMHLVSRQKQCVHVDGTEYLFQEGDTIHTEKSYKFTVEGFRALAARAGFTPGKVWLDAQRLFSVHWLAA